MPATIESANQAMVPVISALMSTRGGINAKTKILDFGCGVGRHTREFREAGFDATGVDRPYEGLAEDLAALPDGGVNVHLSSPEGVLPFDDDTFDLCFSTSVFEHVMDYDQPIAEMARVLKPGGWTVHMFPARWRPIESHIYVPFGARIQNKAWLRLWAQAGIRNTFQQEMDAKATAEANYRYCREGLNYPTKRQVERAFRAYFAEVSFAEDELVHATAAVSRVSRVAVKVIDLPGAQAVYRGLHNRCVVARNS